MPEQYNRTLTLFWVRLVAHVSARQPAATFAEFLAAEEWLLEPGPRPAALLGGAALEPARPGGVGRPRPHRDARLSRIVWPRPWRKPTASYARIAGTLRGSTSRMTCSTSSRSKA